MQQPPGIIAAAASATAADKPPAVEGSSGSFNDLNYTLRLGTEHVQRLSNFLFMPYSFSGPQRNGEEYSMFCSLQTLIDLAFIQISTGEQLLISDITSSPLALLSQLKWVSLSYLVDP